MSDLSNFINSQQFESEGQFHKRVQLYRENIKSREQILEQLVLSSKWASWLPFGWMQSIAGKYFAKKTNKLYKEQFKEKV